jgi:hypothetical protein
VVKTIRKGEGSAEETIEKRDLVDAEIADYFKQIYKRPTHIVRETGGMAYASQSLNASEVNEDQVMRDEEEKMVVEESKDVEAK